MNPARMAGRNCKIFSARKGILKDFDISFNKRSKSLINTGFANVKESPGMYVEGVLYEIDTESLGMLDKCEGYPRHYNRTQKTIHTDQGEELAEVYIANTDWVTEGLKPSKEYLAHLLEAKDILSDVYFNRLKSILTTDI
jgi:gamma-glutamylcyclotransferase (GGCT)/AIG2-like uncharacterized protein YtfP